MTITRRDAIKKAALIFGGSFLMPDILKAWNEPIQNIAFIGTPEQQVMIAEIAELIIPTTDTPGAKAAGVPDFINKMVADCMTEKERTNFYTGLSDLDKNCMEKYGKGFMAASEAERTDILQLSEKRAMDTDRKLIQGKPFFNQIKELTVTGYFTSEIGATKALRYEAVPGRYDGALPYKKGDKAWAT